MKNIGRLSIENCTKRDNHVDIGNFRFSGKTLAVFSCMSTAPTALLNTTDWNVLCGDDYVYVEDE